MPTVVTMATTATMPLLKTVIRVSQVSADESMGGIIGGWGAAGAIPRAQGGGGRCE